VGEIKRRRIIWRELNLGCELRACLGRFYMNDSIFRVLSSCPLEKVIFVTELSPNL